jgi:hypothetical protein
VLIADGRDQRCQPKKLGVDGSVTQQISLTAFITRCWRAALLTAAQMRAARALVGWSGACCGILGLAADHPAHEASDGVVRGVMTA